MGSEGRQDEIERDGKLEERGELRKSKRYQGCRALRRGCLWPGKEVPQPLEMGESKMMKRGGSVSWWGRGVP